MTQQMQVAEAFIQHWGHSQLLREDIISSKIKQDQDINQIAMSSCECLHQNAKASDTYILKKSPPGFW
jgi:hypothetical protein